VIIIKNRAVVFIFEGTGYYKLDSVRSVHIFKYSLG